MGQPYSKVIVVGDVEVTVYALKVLCNRLQRGAWAIRNWERKKIIPTPLVRTKDTFRWYTEAEIELYERLMEEEQVRNGVSFKKTQFTARAFGEQKLLGEKLKGKLKDTMK